MWPATPDTGTDVSIHQYTDDREKEYSTVYSEFIKTSYGYIGGCTRSSKKLCGETDVFALFYIHIHTNT